MGGYLAERLRVEMDDRNHAERLGLESADDRKRPPRGGARGTHPFQDLGCREWTTRVGPTSRLFLREGTFRQPYRSEKVGRTVCETNTRQIEGSRGSDGTWAGRLCGRDLTSAFP
jgi:hypothetical protein